MTVFSTLAVTAAIILGSSGSTQASNTASSIAPPLDGLAALETIETRYRAGLLDAQTRHLFRVALVKAPHRLPSDLRPAAGAMSRIQPLATSILVEAWQWVARTGGAGGPVHELLQPPADLPYVLDSSVWPIRVSYRDAYDEHMAQVALSTVEESWTVEIDGFGFYEPPRRDASDLYRIFIDRTGMGGGGYTAPYDVNPDTPWFDCFTYIVIDPQNAIEYLDGVMAHEANHAMQAAMDCGEVVTFWENTAVYIASQVFDSAGAYALASMPYFQSQPWKALDYMRYPDSDLYEYGGGLFAFYLAGRYGHLMEVIDRPGAHLIRAIWEASMQTVQYNEPDYYDAIEDVLAHRGEVTTMQDVLLDFSEARFFVGDRDDDQHIDIYAALGSLWGYTEELWRDAKLTLVAEHRSSDLPLVDRSPMTSQRPSPFGANHVLTTFPEDYAHAVTVLFDGDDETEWAVRLVRFDGSRPTVFEDMALAEPTWDGSHVVDMEGYRNLLMVVTNRGHRGYDPDSRTWPTADYQYTLQPDIPPPELHRLEPDVVERGQQYLRLRLRGQGFVNGPDFFIRFDDPDIQVGSVISLNETEVLFEITVPRLTAIGAKTLILTNAGGATVSGEGMLEVVEIGALDPPGPSDDGCGCRSAPGRPTPGLLLLLVLGWLVRRRMAFR